MASLPRLWPAIDVRLSPGARGDADSLQGAVLAALDDSDVTAVQELPWGWRIFFAAGSSRDAGLAVLAEKWPEVLAAAPVDVPDEDWARRSQQNLGPVGVGGVVIWPEAPDEAGRPDAAVAAGGGRAPDPSSPRDALAVVIRPSMGFGTGHHATTRLCLALLQQDDLARRRVLDVGTGSGVLAIVASRLGAGTVVAVDEDPDALGSARENAALNGVTGIDFRHADFRKLPDAGFDLVVANLTGALLVRGVAVLSRAVAEGGSLVVSGLTADEEPDVAGAFAPRMTVTSRLEEDGWVGLRLVHARR